MRNRGLRAIYTPRGAAREYAELALNPYKGCTHRCIYCYNNGRYGKPGQFFSGPQPRDNIVNLVRRDCRVLKTNLGDLCPEIHLSFLGDCYQPAEDDLQITRQIIEILIHYNLAFTILTKSPLILRDVDLLAPYPHFRAGFSFTSVDQDQVDAWEPGTGDIKKRISALQQFSKMGKLTWISLEPVMSIDATLEVINTLGNLAGFYWIGALNHISPPKPIDKKEARQRIGAALDRLGCKYAFKNSFNFS